MSDILQKHFVKLTEAPNLKLLESQWSFDQKLIPKALQAVGQLFPHYSRHDQSHSDQILINIERVLGEDRVEMLSATDIWLLLEAAYWHDIGMVIPQQALMDALDDPEFQTYRRQVAAENGHELQKFAGHFKGKSVTEAFSGADTPLDAVEKFRMLMAEWFRRQHAKRSEKSVNDPWQELGLSSPRTELIPKRLFRLLGSICAMHGATFTDVLRQLPHKEVGMANDDCHPRFVACLLRLGDLLDLDDNRFCPVMQRISGDSRPALSRAHEDKHSSIRNFRLNPERIEIVAVCDSIEGYVEQWRWLDYLRDEIQNQMACWLDIAPSAKLGLLPTLGTIKVDIAGKQLITKPGKRPEFTLNASRVMTLLKGENLYQREDVVRELLQNAVDATLIRVWLTSQSEEKVVDVKPDKISDDYFKQFPISVYLERVENPEPPISTGKIKWQFTLVDQGVGICQADLPYLMNIAGSSTNAKRQTVIEAMPEWMQPSGTFGIGLQSVFMRTDEVKIETKCFYTHEALDITLHSPTGSKRGLVTVERVDNAYLRRMGTTLRFAVITDSSPFGHSIANDQRLTNQALESYDGLLDKEMSLSAWKIIDAINNFAKHSPIQVNWEFKNYQDQVLCNDGQNNGMAESNDFFCETNSKFAMTFDSTSRGRHGAELSYRGQTVKDAKIGSYYFINYKLDLYAGKAGDWLTFNRNGLTSEGREKISELVQNNVRLWVERNKNSLLVRQKAELSLLAKMWANNSDNCTDQVFWQGLSNEVSDAWLDLRCDVWTNDKVVEATYRLALVKDVFILNERSRSVIIEPPVENLVLANHYETPVCVQEWCRDPQHGIRYITSVITEHGSNRKTLLIQLIEVEAGGERLQVSSQTLTYAIESNTRHVMWNRRLLIPLMLFPKDMKMDRLILEDNIRILGGDYIFEQVPEPMPHILLPYEINTNLERKSSCKLDRFEEFVSWVHAHLKAPLSLQETKTAYDELVEFVDAVVMKDSKQWKELRGTQ